MKDVSVQRMTVAFVVVAVAVGKCLGSTIDSGWIELIETIQPIPGCKTRNKLWKPHECSRGAVMRILCDDSWVCACR